MSNRHVLVLLCALAAVVGGAVGSLLAPVRTVVAQEAVPVPKVVTAGEFHLIDPFGQVRATLALSADGQPYLNFKDEHDVARVWAGISSETGVAIRDVDGKTRVVLSVDDAGFPSLVVRGRDHRTNSFHPAKD